MNQTPTTQEEAADDALAEALADAWVADAAHDARLCRLALRAMGLRKEPADMTADELAREHGTDRFALNRIALRALHKLKLSPEIQALKSQS